MSSIAFLTLFTSDALGMLLCVILFIKCDRFPSYWWVILVGILELSPRLVGIGELSPREFPIGNGELIPREFAMCPGGLKPREFANTILNKALFTGKVAPGEQLTCVTSLQGGTASGALLKIGWYVEFKLFDFPVIPYDGGWGEDVFPLSSKKGRTAILLRSSIFFLRL